MPTNDLCLVTGATGALGPSLVERLLEEGYRVRLMARGPIAPDPIHPSVETVRADITHYQEVALALSGVGTVFHLAAKLHLPDLGGEMPAEFERINVEGTRVLVEAAAAAGVGRLVFFSTISVYGPTGPHPVDEAAPPRPATIYARTKLEAEQLVISARDSSGHPLGVVLRLAAAYGPRVKGNYSSLVRAIDRGRFVPVGNGSSLKTLVYHEDVARAAVLAARHPAAAGQVYNVSDGSVHTMREIIVAISAALGRRAPSLYFPLPVARLAAAVGDGALALVGQPRRLGAAVEKFVESAAVRAERIQQELGFAPEHDLERGWRQTVAGMRGEG